MNEPFLIPPDLSPLWISLKVSLLATVFTFFVGIAVAYWMLGDRGKGKSLLEGILISPLILPPTVVGFLLLWLLGKNGPLGQLLLSFDLSVVFTWYGAVIAATVVSFPLMYRTALGAFEQVDPHLLAVARTLGASEWTVFRRIMLPLAWPGVVAGTMLAFARALGEFGATLMLAGNIPGQTQTIPMAIYFAVEAGAMTEAWFWAIAMMLISLSGITAVSFWQERRQKQQNKQQNKQRIAPRDSKARVYRPFPGAPASYAEVFPQPVAAPPSGLVVNLQKRLATFDLDLALSTAESTLGILGGSGAGKSMLLRCIAGIETPTQGQIVLNGRVLFDSARGINVPSRDRRIGFLMQNYALFPTMTVAQNIAFGLPKSLSAGEVKQRVQAQLEAIQLQGYGDRYPSQLSGGQQQRVALARAIASEPDALLLDEPFSALDPQLRSELEKQLTKTLLNYQGLTLFVSHNLGEAYRICQNLLVLSAGAVVANGQKKAIFERPSNLTVAQLTGCKNVSRIQPMTPHAVQALDWNCTLISPEPISSTQTHVGIRAHHITLVKTPASLNTFPAWLVWTREMPHCMTLYLKLGAPPTDPDDYHLQTEVDQKEWEGLTDRPFPWLVSLDSSRLLWLDP